MSGSRRPLLNQLVGAKVAITSDRPQTTRSAIRGVRTTDKAQIVFSRYPGPLHRPRTALGERTNARALGTLSEVDTVCLIVEANAAYGPGDRFVADRVRESGTPAILVVNKIDVARREQVVAHLGEAEATLGQFESIVPCARPAPAKASTSWWGRWRRDWRRVPSTTRTA